MLGSVHDAEDALQEVMLRTWRGLPGFEGRSSLRSWLYRIATNTCLNAIDKRPKRVLPVDFGPSADPDEATFEPLAESIWIEPLADGALGLDGGLTVPEATYEQREGVELAFIAALQHLPANQRAALILREVLGFSAREVAETLETSTASVNSALQRARKLIDERLPERSQQETLRSLGDRRLREIVDAYVEAMESGDAAAVISLLTDDVTWSMPPTPVWYMGHEEVGRFLAKSAFQVQWRRIATRANGQPAVAGYARQGGGGEYEAFVLDVLTLRDGKIAAITAFLDDGVLRRFGLPDALPSSSGSGPA